MSAVSSRFQRSGLFFFSTRRWDTAVFGQQEASQRKRGGKAAFRFKGEQYHHVAAAEILPRARGDRIPKLLPGSCVGLLLKVPLVAQTRVQVFVFGPICLVSIWF